MPAISLVTVINGPTLIAGSMSALRKRIGAVEPMTEATPIAKTITNPTAFPKSGDV